MPPRGTARLRAILAGLDGLVSGTGETSASVRIALFAFAVRVVSAAIAFASQVLLARWMGSFEYGVFVVVLVASVILGGLSCLGFQTAVIRFVPDYRATGRLELLRGILLVSRVFAFATASLLAGLGLLALFAVSGAVPDYYVLPLVLGAFCLPVMALGEVLDGTSRAHALAGLSLLPTFIVRPILILLYMALATTRLGFPASAATAVGCLLAATWTTTAGQLLLVGRRTSARAGRGARTLAFGAWAGVALPIFLVEGFFNLLTNVDILMVGHFLPPADVAVYYASVKTLALVHFVYFAVKASAAQRFSQYRHSGDTERYDAFVKNTVAWTFWPSLGVAVLMLLGGRTLLGLFGEEFRDGLPLLFILVAGVLARAAVGPAESVLTMSGEQNACAAVYLAAIVLSVALNAMLIPLHGLTGAALSTTLAMVFEAFALHVVARRRLGLNLFILARRIRTRPPAAPQTASHPKMHP